MKTYTDKKTDFLSDEMMSPYHNNRSDENSWKVSWGHVDQDIMKIWRDYNTRGEGVRVAVIDTGGSDNGNDLSGRFSGQSMSVIGTSYTDTDERHHGTMSAGLIAANALTARRVFGVAPACELVIIRAGDNGFFPDKVELALKEAYRMRAKVVSMSIENLNAPADSMRQVVRDCAAAGMILVAASGDEGVIHDSYPASCDGCISVGAYALDDSGNRLLWEDSNGSASLMFLAPGKGLLSCSPDPSPASYDGTSAATAFAAGVFALVVTAAGNGGITFATLSAAIASGKCTAPLDGVASNQQGHGVLDSLALIQFFKHQ